MSKLIAVRIPDEMMGKIEARGSTSSVVLAALTEYFSGPQVGKALAMDQEERNLAPLPAHGQHPERIPASEPGARIATWTERASSPATKCTQTGHTGFYRSDGYWCATCRKMYVR
jgi:hypothetical protein